MPSIQSSPKPLVLPELPPSATPSESLKAQKVIDFLHLQPHAEGGYFVETDRDSFEIPSPFLDNKSTSKISNPFQTTESKKTNTRAASTTIFYYITSGNPIGAFHSNKARTIHTLHWGRGRYVLIHADEVSEPGHKARVETFVVGKNLLAGEKMQWIVEGGVYKSSFLFEDGVEGDGTEGLLISETVVPGFEYTDHDFLSRERLEALVSPAQARELRGLLVLEGEEGVEREEERGEEVVVEGRKPRHWESFGMMI